MTTPEPGEGIEIPDAHMAISHKFLDQARTELAGGDYLQASEKV